MPMLGSKIIPNKYGYDVTKLDWIAEKREAKRIKELRKAEPTKVQVMPGQSKTIKGGILESYHVNDGVVIINYNSQKNKAKMVYVTVGCLKLIKDAIRPSNGDMLVFAKTNREGLSPLSTKLLGKIEEMVNTKAMPMEGYKVIGIDTLTGNLYRH